ncbi:MAG TPA: tyrosine-type recombinase/integrase, partial [Anaerolineales bacterium]|nr:tyrosine-type recombinase/integrase [Anaerolineales bacterium]
RQRDVELRDERVWPWCRTTAWTKVKRLMLAAGITGPWAVPKGLRHGLAVEGTAEAKIPLNVMQKWLGHARIETTALYADALGKEERDLAERIWT